jgi:hypothetical protein
LAEIGPLSALFEQARPGEPQAGVGFGQGGIPMQSDRYLRAVLTVIAVCLVWICLQLVDTASAFGGSQGTYQIAVGGQQVAYRLNTESGQVCTYLIGESKFGACSS